MSVAEFRGHFLEMLRKLGATVEFHGRPNEVPDPIPFIDDKAESPYDAEAVTRFFHACLATERVLQRFRSSFLGKVSPVHLFWGSFDLAVTRFSGRPAPPRPGGSPPLPAEATRGAHVHQGPPAGAWPGTDRLECP